MNKGVKGKTLKNNHYCMKKIFLDIMGVGEVSVRGTGKNRRQERGQLMEETGHSVVEQRGHNLTLAESDFLLSKLLHAVKKLNR